MRYRVTFGIDTTDPDTTTDDVQRAAAAAEILIANALPGAWVDLDTLEELGT